MESSTVHPPAWPWPPMLRWARAVSAASSRPAPARPLVVSSDEELLDDLLRLLAAAGTEPELATGGPSLRRAPRAAPLVLVGADALAGGVLRALPQRPGVVVVSGREFPADQWAAPVELRAERVAQLPEDEAWLLSRAAAAVRGQVERGRLVAVGGGCGGAGASTVAAASRSPPARGPCSSPPTRGAPASTSSSARSTPTAFAGPNWPVFVAGWRVTHSCPPCPRSRTYTSWRPPGRPHWPCPRRH